ncbi:hypothetical protein ATB98_22645 [Sinorhizobium saheli]|uniref:Uncharacterized protein n=1 Tax=Sinorhizobium saheli TaxID=36856 RepID=A0A178XG10_SINSA|nr:hypothetical protein ATB98_22645 [Sinorhizobium saheli]
MCPWRATANFKFRKIYADDTGFSWLGLKRLPSGRFLLSSSMSKFASAVFWFLCLALFILGTREA